MTTRPPIVRARALIAVATRLLEDHPELIPLARRERRHGFAGGARWMAGALSILRADTAPPSPPDVGWQRLGVTKYALCLLAAAVATAAALPFVPLFAAVVGVLIFYVVEVQFVFAFPIALDSHARPLRKSASVLRHSTGTLRGVATVVPLATVMLFGGFVGRGFVRSWCVGCLGVLVWYEHVHPREGGR